MSKSNKKVKQMMCDAFNGNWSNNSLGIFTYKQKGMRFNVFCGWWGNCPTYTALSETVSVKANGENNV